MKVQTAHLSEYSRPWPVAVGSRKGMRKGWLLNLFDAQGGMSRGEAAPLPPFTEENHDDCGKLLAQLVAPGSSIYDRVFETVDDISEWIEGCGPCNTAKHALEQALLCLLARSQGRDVGELFTDHLAPIVHSHALVETPAEALAAVVRGHHALKVKVGGIPAVDARDRIREIRKQVGPHARLRIDANQGWTYEEALSVIRGGPELGIEFVEEPLKDATTEELVRLHAETGTALACDESVRTLEALNEVISSGAFQVLVIKPMFVGGIIASLALAKRATEAGMKIVVTTALDGDIALAHSQLCARLCPAEALLACGLHPTSSTSHGAPTVDPEVSIPHPLVAAASARPDHNALVADNGSWSYSDLSRNVAKRATGLRLAGILPGQRVALALERTYESLLDFWALGWLGAVPVLVDASVPAVATAEARALLNCISIPGSIPDSDVQSRPHRWALRGERLILFSSGSTGEPKPVVLSTEQLVFSALGQAGRIGHHLDDVWACALPLHHVGGISILLRTMWLHTTTRLYRRWHPSEISRDIDQGAITLVSLVPTMLEELLDVREDRMTGSTLRAILLGGAKASSELLERCKSLALPVALTWGMTESASQVATNVPGDLNHTIAPLLSASVTSQDGALHIASPLVRGDYRSNDSGLIHADGRLEILGRLDDVIISGGKNISLTVIRNTLLRHPAVSDALAISVDDAKWGQRPWALIVPVADQAMVTASELNKYLRDSLPSYVCPDRYAFVTTIPRNAMGKALYVDALSAFESPPKHTPNTDELSSVSGYHT